ncbi:DUF4302 domain-containing protein [Sphingobacterium endophyticum]|uniref:DUF4302 domain-containing protein n=1 Tax=Sphingobacterium endophyticum TaxID=2546448 RepID=UPI0012E24384|nr:DUF4302 domain-containing protein [Sphingobacterium endophyticum]
MKYLITTICLCFLLLSCKKEFEGTRPDSKINQLKEEYSDQLIKSKEGWIGILYPKGGGSYTFKFSFDNKNRVKTYATIDKEKTIKSDESSYRLVADQIVSLYFDTYSYLHQLADPDERKNGGLRGGGKISDFEFSFIQNSKDTIKLRGNHNESELILIRAKEGEGDNYISKTFAQAMKIDELNQLSNYYNSIQINKKDYGFILNTEINCITFYYDDKGNYKSFTTEYAVIADGIVLRKPFEANGVRISTFSDFQINKTTNQISVQYNGQVKAQIKNVSKPISIDKEAPRRMYMIDKMHTSSTGFTISGVKDAIGLTKIQGFNMFLFIPRRYIDPLDAFYLIHSEDFHYGPIFNTIYNDEGVLFFKPFQLLSGIPPGTAYEQLFIDQNKLWFDPAGFNVFQTGKDCFDFVSRKDSKIWIRFK